MSKYVVILDFLFQFPIDLISQTREPILVFFNKNISVFLEDQPVR